MRVAYIGNFEPPHSTENHIARALENNGHTVVRLNERPWAWKDLAEAAWLDGDGCDFALWTSTGGYAPPETFELQRMMLKGFERLGTPTVGYHLDLWWGLHREHEVFEKPFFTVDLLCTADGGHDERWAEAGINHAWFSPAISRDEAQLGHFWHEFESDIAFVGSWQGGYHHESTHRFELVRWLRDNYGDRCTFWPKKDRSAIRGGALQDLFASTKVVVGDSCMVPHYKRYWSDRIPETTGRGAFLIHPEVVGLRDQHPFLVTWPAGQWIRLAEAIQRALEYNADRERIARLCYEDTVTNHTYERRMTQLIDLMKTKGML